MSRDSAKAHLDRRPGDPTDRWLTPSRVKEALDTVYTDMPVIEQQSTAEFQRPEIVAANMSPWPAALAEQVAEAQDLNLDLVFLPVRIAGDQDDGAWPAYSSSNRADVVGADLTYAVSQATSGMAPLIAIEAYPWVNDGNTSELIWNPPNKTEWFINWRTSVLQILDAIHAAGVQPWAVNIGANMTELETAYTSEWTTLITAIRSAYPTIKIIYRTDQWQTAPGPYAVSPEVAAALEAALTAKIENPIWALVDYISVAGYFETTEAANPSTETLISCLYDSHKYGREQPIFDQCERFANRWGKKLLFGEWAVSYYPTGASTPWDPYGTGTKDKDLQMRLMRAYLTVFGGQSWWAGFSLYGIGHAWENGYDLQPSAKRLIRNLGT